MKMAIDIGRYMLTNRLCTVIAAFPEKLTWCLNERVCQGVCYERSYGLDTVLWNNNNIFYLI